VDSSVFYSGRQSMRISSATTVASTDYAGAAQFVPANLFRSTKLHLSGFVQTQGVTGFATLWLQVYGAQTQISFTDLEPSAPTGTSGWRRYDVYADLTSDAAQVGFGIRLVGNGTAWFDGLAVDADGNALSLSAGPPRRDQLQWIRQNTIPFTTLDPGVNDAELAPLQKIVGNARIVGLGEGTHGTSEFFRMKSRIVSYLARNMGFTIFAIEANMPEAYQMNNYVLNGVGDPKQLLTGMYFWTWNTQEVLDMVTWMRQFNLSGQGRIEFLGFDMQFAAAAMANVTAFVSRVDPQTMGTVANYYQAMLPVPNEEFGLPTPAQTSVAANAAQAVLQLLQSKRATYILQQPAADVDWAIQNANIVVQAIEDQQSGVSYRDQQMAVNVEWIASQNPGARIVLWAHDGHIEKAPGAMGGALARYFGSDYVALGSFFHAGVYTAVNSTSLGPNVAVASFPGSLEYMFHQTRIPRQILNLHLAQPSDPASSWLFGSFWDRMIGAVAEPGFALDSALTQEFDAIVYFDQTTPSTLLPFPANIQTQSLPPGKIGEPYFQELVSDDSPGPSWAQVAGTMPPGLSLRAGGVLIGTPVTAGTYNFTVQVGQDANAASAQLQVTVTN
jgi:erythromycin esterase